MAGLASLQPPVPRGAQPLRGLVLILRKCPRQILDLDQLSEQCGRAVIIPMPKQQGHSRTELACRLRNDRETDDGVAAKPEGRSTTDAVSADHISAHRKELPELPKSRSKRADDGLAGT